MLGAVQECWCGGEKIWALSTTCNLLCIRAVRFKGNLKSKELCVLIGMFFPHAALSSHDIPCLQNEVPQGQSLQIFSTTFVGAAEQMPKLPSFLQQIHFWALHKH